RQRGNPGHEPEPPRHRRQRPTGRNCAARPGAPRVCWDRRECSTPSATPGRLRTLPHPEVRAAVRLPPADGAELTLELTGPGARAAVALRRQGGKVVLVDLARHPVEVALAHEGGRDDPGAAWAVRCRLHYGVVQAKAWPDGRPEPPDWRAVRYSGTTGW